MAYSYEALSITMRFDYTSIQMRIAICRDIWPIVSERWQDEVPQALRSQEEG